MSEHTSETSCHSWSASIAFWSCLLISAALFALVSLSPKLHDYLTLREEHYQNQVRMVLLEQQVKYLQKVSNALEHDHDFAAELARLDFAATHPDEEQIPVDSRLSMEAQPMPSVLPQVHQQAFTIAIVEHLAQRHALRKGLLISSACLVIFAFAFLHDAHSSRVNQVLSGVIRARKRLWRRYQSH